jgi:hypothetical protein
MDTEHQDKWTVGTTEFGTKLYQPLPPPVMISVEDHHEQSSFFMSILPNLAIGCLLVGGFIANPVLFLMSAAVSFTVVLVAAR